MIMKKSINGGLLALSCLLLVGLAMTGSADDSSAGTESFEAAYQSAEKARKEAAAAGFEWRDTGKILAQSKELAEGGDYEAAIKLANRAQQESDLAVMQAQTEAESWEQRAVK
jgi:hypothetical protein